MPQVQAYNGWDQLEEVWLGDVWPKSFYDDLDPTVRDSFYQITDMTREDLDNIQRVLEGLGVKVCRPVIDESRKDLYINPQTGKLYKPPIAVRDLNCVIVTVFTLAKQHWKDAGARTWIDMIKIRQCLSLKIYLSAVPM